MKKLLIIAITLLALTGCATPVAPVPLATAPANGKVGVLVTVADKPTYSYMGSSIFSKEQYVLEDSWGVEDFVNDYMNKHFASKPQYSVHKLPAAKFIKQATNYIIYPKNKAENNNDKETDTADDKDEVSLESVIAAYRTDLSLKNDLDILVHVEPYQGIALYNSGFYINGYGVFTRCYFGSCTAHVVNHVRVTIYDGKTQSVIGKGKYVHKKPKFAVDFPEGAKILPKSGSDAGREIYIDALETMLTEALAAGQL